MPTSHRFTSTALHDTHNVSSFRCGAPELDAWLRNHAMAASLARVARTFVWTGASRDTEARVVAYYSLSAHAVLRGEAPSRISRGVADPVPAALIGKLALDQELHGQGLGAVLLADALERIINASASGLAVRAIVVDASTDRGRALYTRFGFVPAPGRAERMIVRAETIARGLGARSVPD